MHSQRSRTAPRSWSTVSLATLSGLAVIGTLAGCSNQSLAASVTGPPASANHAAAQPKPPPPGTPTVTPTPSSPSAATVPAVAPPTAAKPPAATQPVVAAPTPSTSPTSVPKPIPTVSLSTYVDGNYSATGSYSSPGGRETIRVTLDLRKDIVTDLAVTSVSVDSTAANYEAAFEGGIQAVAAGRDIGSLNVGPVAGSSLTSIGFNRAIAIIKGSARR